MIWAGPFLLTQLPVSSTNEFNEKLRDSPLEGKDYYPSSNDIEEVVVCQLPQSGINFSPFKIFSLLLRLPI